MDLNQQRQKIRAWRKSITPTQQQTESQAVAKQLQLQPAFASAHTIGAYIAQENEIDPSPIIKMARELGKSIYLPRMSEHKQYHLDFYAYNRADKLNINSYGIAEPNANANKIEPWKLDLVLLPLVAFDQFCNRVGRGVGFYDRCFAFVNELPQADRPQLIGLAYQEQKIASITAEPWDVAMDLIVCSDSIYNKPNMD